MQAWLAGFFTEIVTQVLYTQNGKARRQAVDSSAYELLRHYVSMLLEAKRRVPDAAPPPVTTPMGAPTAASATPTDPATASAAVLSMHSVDKGHIESCLSVVVTALAVVMAGTGHLPTLRLIQALSLRRHPVQGADVSGLGITVGSHMMTNMAAGQCPISMVAEDSSKKVV
ncbi:hypothetical protein DUNSADRAFT_5362 [Dunaliella salina]|uniref:Encoded protein n=1 Tax=Dunaliella salina TaxID=3046 RepID=A0ABQ7GQD7_DUNSA|nr:hypothetical protein DUNSADRAFT_5362 [Dunaliella salina]|eukprot:KAF5836822.1 hypothetical protein DUNSADRAFT_5362 [Dunaliella salina]